MEYCIVALNYPTPKRHIHVFLENVVIQFADRGINCNVIAPQSVFSYFVKKDARREFVSERTTPNGTKYKVYSPLYMVFPTKKIGRLHLADFSKKSFYRAVERTYKKYKMNADVVYSHFVQAGVAAVKLAKKIGASSFIANGEADTIDSLKYLSKKLVAETLEDVTGIISVSTKNKDEIYELCNGNEAIMQKVRIIPNAVDGERFYKKDRLQCREKLGWPKDAFIVAFTGSFIERKGVLRLANALDKFDDVYSVFIGTGEENPQCKNILHCGRISNSDMCDYLNAADIFVLPTLAEGCSNAIVEAVACGLPVVSSDMSFNYDVLDDACSILIDPMDEVAIGNAIKLLKDNVALRDKLSGGSCEKSKNLSIHARVDKILDFIN